MSVKATRLMDRLQTNGSPEGSGALEAKVAVNGKEYTVDAEGRLRSNDCNGARSFALAFDASLKLPRSGLVRIDIVMPLHLKFKSASRLDREDRNHAPAQTGSIDAAFPSYTFRFHTTANHRFEARHSVP